MMRWLLATAGAAALVGQAYCQDPPPDSKKMADGETGLTFSSYTNDKGIHFNVAVPDTTTANTAYDAVVQIVAPKDIGWVGMAWGGSMTYNPLAIVWANGNDIVLSSRMAYGYYVPPAYPEAKYTVLKKGTHVNATHFQVTAKCSGCTKWGDDDTGITFIDPKIDNPLAFAYSTVPVDQPSNPASGFGIHELIGHWIHSFKDANNAGFDAAVAKLA